MYTLTKDGAVATLLQGIVRNADGAHIPADPANRDWLAYLAWLKAGNKPAEPPAPPPGQA